MFYTKRILIQLNQYLKTGLKKCCPVKVIGEPDIIPLNFKKAIIEPVKVMAPIDAPRHFN